MPYTQMVDMTLYNIGLMATNYMENLLLTYLLTYLLHGAEPLLKS